MKTDHSGDDSTRPYYDHDEDWSWRSARAFPLWSSHSPREYDRLLAILLQLGRGSGHMLDVGCGAGRLGTHARAAGYEYLGVDDSVAGIALGQASFPDLSLAVCDFVQPIPVDYVGTFDVVASVNVLHCIVEDAHRAQFLSHLQAAKKQEGCVALTTMCAPTAEGFRLSRRPRVHKEVPAILEEVRASGLEIVRYDVRGLWASAKISNLTVFAV